MAMADSKAPVRLVKRVQFGILSPDEIVSVLNVILGNFNEESFTWKPTFLVHRYNMPTGSWFSQAIDH